MAKVERPLWSDEATGRVGTIASFKKGPVWDSITPQFHRNQSPSLQLKAQRNNFSAACKAWRILTENEKQWYRDNAPAGMTGFQYFMQSVL